MITIRVKEYANTWLVELYTKEGRLFKTKELPEEDIREFIGFLRMFYDIFDVEIDKVIYEYCPTDLLHLQ